MNTQHNFLRERYAQHVIKNEYSKKDDATAKEASKEVVEILSKAYPNHNFELKFNLTFKEIESYIGRKFDLNYDFSQRKLLPDGGIIWMDNKYPILISEMKRQGTNNERLAEGKKKQAVGNAIERLGKNLIGFKCLFENESILPFICFIWGCDVDDGTFLGKLYTLNSFYEINQVYAFPINIYNKPFTCLTKRDSSYNMEEMISKMLEIAEYSIKYFESKEANNCLI